MYKILFIKHLKLIPIGIEMCKFKHIRTNFKKNVTVIVIFRYVKDKTGANLQISKLKF